MKIKRIIFLIQQYFTLRDYERFGIEILKNNGFEVSVWDLGAIIYPETVEALADSCGRINKENSIRFYSLKEVILCIRKENENSFFMSTIPYTFKTMKIFIEISRLGCKYGGTGTYTRGVIPINKISAISNGLINKLIDPRIIEKIIFYILKKLENKCIKLTFPIFRINYACYFPIIGGGAATASGPIINKETYCHYIHSFDYDQYLLKNDTCISEDFIVFIDQYLPFHSDWQLSKTKLVIDPELYYKDLRNFFDIIEKKTALNVIIAAHPKANYKGKESLFGSRAIVHGFNSNDLIRKTKLVLLHYSMAINLAVLYRKPMLFLTSDMLNKTSVGNYIYSQSRQFNTLPININHYLNKNNLFFVDHDLYDRYQNNYIKKPGTKEELFWQQVANHIAQSY